MRHRIWPSMLKTNKEASAYEFLKPDKRKKIKFVIPCPMSLFQAIDDFFELQHVLDYLNLQNLVARTCRHFLRNYLEESIIYIKLP